MVQVLLSFGLILVIDEVRQLLFGKDVHSVLPPEGLRGAIQRGPAPSSPDVLAAAQAQKEWVHNEALSRIDIAAQCVMCGLCLPHCPSYVVTRIESDSPRGRLALMAKIATGEISNTQHPSLDRCLACGRCERACPPKVR